VRKAWVVVWSLAALGSVQATAQEAGENLPAQNAVDAEPSSPVDLDAPAAGEPSPDAGVLQEPAAGELTPTSPSPSARPESVEAPPLDSRPSFETVVVGTSEAQTSGSLHLIKSSQLERFERDDPHGVLASAPGVYVRGEDGFGLRPNVGLRGANSDRSKKVTLLEDGVLFAPAPYSAPAAYYFPLITRMQSVSVLKGPAAIIHGPNTVGGSVELLTRDIPGGQSLLVDAAGGEHLYGKLHAVGGATLGDTGFLVEGIHLRSSGFKVLDSGGDTGFYRNEWMLKARHRLSGTERMTQELALKAGWSNEGSNETYLGLSDEDFRAQPLRRYAASAFDRMSWNRTSFVGTHRLAMPAFTLTTNLYRHDFDRTWRKVNHFRGAALADVLADPDSPRMAPFASILRGESDSLTAGEQLFIGPNHRTFVSQGLQTVARAELSTGPVRHELELGARYHFDSIHRAHTEDAFTLVGGSPLSAGLPTSTTANNTDSTHALALHAMDALSWKILTLTPGVRMELIRSSSEDALAGETQRGGVLIALPGVGLHAQVHEHVGLFAGIHRGFSAPAPGAIRPEESVNTEAGVRWTRGGERLEVIGFYNDYSNLTDLCTFSNGCLENDLDQQFSIGHALIAGAEVFAEKRFRVNGELSFPVSATYTFTRTRLEESFDSADPQFGDVEVGDELPYVPRHLARVSAGMELGGFGIHVSANYTGAMRELAGQGPQVAGEWTDELFTLDLAANVQLAEGIKLYGTAQNLLDRQVIVARRPFGARPNAPREVHVGLKLEL
jgi:Fe(3+) dicitrate transport protein